jgi:16S rRNA (guanine527-N7)-methyltransferase
VKFTLIDSIAKKIRVVNEIAAAAGVANVLALTTRAENLTGEYDFIVGRAVTETEQFVRLTRHLLSKHSFNTMRNGWILLKGGDLGRELRPFLPGATVVPVSNWFDEPYFETKKIVYLPR